MSPPRLRIAAGALLWLGLAGWGAGLALSPRTGGERSLASDLASYWFRVEATREVRFREPVILSVGDRVEVEGSGAGPEGEVSALLEEDGDPLPHLTDWVRAARVRLYDRGRFDLRRDARARLVRVPDLAGAWVFRTLFPEEKLERVKAAWNVAWRRDRDRIYAVVVPVLEELVEEVDETVKSEAPRFFERHRREIDALFREVEDEVDPEKMTRLFDRSVWPIARRHLEPIMDDIGKEIWERLPIWGLSWRLAYQSLPFTRDDHFERRWHTFIGNEVTPLLKSHASEFFTASRSIVRETLENREVAAMLHELVMRLASHPGFHRLRQVFVREVFLDNPEFRARLETWWESPRVREAVRFVSARLELTVRRISDMVIGTRESGITPEFAQVLRAQILRKGKRRIEIEPGSAPEPLEEGSAIPATVELETER